MMRRFFLAVLPFAVPAVAMAAVVFTDVRQGTWYAPFVQEAANLGIVSGYTDAEGRLTGRFGPGDNVTVAQSLKISVEGAGYNETSYAPVSEMAVGDWFSLYLGVAAEEDFYPYGTMVGPGWQLPATRGQVAQMMADAFNVEQNAPAGAPFADVSASHRFSAAIAALQKDGVVSGDTDASGSATGTFRPDDAINRAETVKIVLKAREVYGTPGTR